MRQAQKRSGFNKVTDDVQALMQPRKPMQRIALLKIQHAHSRGFRSRPVICSDDSRPFPRCRLRPLGCANHSHRRCPDDLR